MKFTLGIIAVSSILSLPAAAHADDTAAPNWSVGAGLSTPGATYPISGSIGVLGSIPSALGLLTVEHRLSPSWWLMLHTDVGFTTASSRAAAGDVYNEAHSALLDLLGGARFAITPDSPLVVSAFILAGGSYRHSEATSQNLSATVKSAGVQAQAGGMIEHELVKDLSLRLSARLFTVAWNRSVWTDGTNEARTDGITAFLSLSPALELRFLL